MRGRNQWCKSARRKFAFGPDCLRQTRRRFAAKFAKENSHGTIDNEKIDIYAHEALKPFENSRGENPYSVQRDLQETMQHNVGIVRNESEMLAELDHLRTYWNALPVSA